MNTENALAGRQQQQRWWRRGLLLLFKNQIRCQEKLIDCIFLCASIPLMTEMYTFLNIADICFHFDLQLLEFDFFYHRMKRKILNFLKYEEFLLLLLNVPPSDTLKFKLSFVLAHAKKNFHRLRHRNILSSRENDEKNLGLISRKQIIE